MDDAIFSQTAALSNKAYIIGGVCLLSTIPGVPSFWKGFLQHQGYRYYCDPPTWTTNQSIFDLHAYSYAIYLILVLVKYPISYSSCLWLGLYKSSLNPDHKCLLEISRS